MNIGVTSENGSKIISVLRAYAYNNSVKRKDVLNIEGYSTDSGVGEQPIGEETLLGARMRITDLNKKVKGLDRIVSIENGIFLELGVWVDKAVVVIYNPKKDVEFMGYSDSVEFPKKFVERARQIGFDKITVGQVMADEGHVVDPKDPHLSISGISRGKYLEKALKDLVLRVE